MIDVEKVEIRVSSAGEVYDLRFNLECFEKTENNINWKLSFIQWKTYDEFFKTDIHHIIYDVWVSATKTDDLLALIDKITEKIHDISEKG